MVDFGKMTKRFLLGEKLDTPGLLSYIQSLEEIVYKLNPTTKHEARRVEIAKEHVRHVKRHSKRLMEKVSVLEERLSILEENTEE